MSERVARGWNILAQLQTPSGVSRTAVICERPPTTRRLVRVPARRKRFRLPGRPTRFSRRLRKRFARTGLLPSWTASRIVRLPGCIPPTGRRCVGKAFVADSTHLMGPHLPHNWRPALVGRARPHLPQIQRPYL